MEKQFYSSDVVAIVLSGNQNSRDGVVRAVSADPAFPVTLTFPAGTKIAAPPTHEILPDGRLRATFTRYELRFALGLLGGCIECHGHPPCGTCPQRKPVQSELFH